MAISSFRKPAPGEFASCARPTASKAFGKRNLRRRAHQPFGIAFFPSGDNPQWVYVANTDSVVRFPYNPGDLKAAQKPETVVAELPHGYGHSTRDIVFTRDDRRMLVSVGSDSNAAEGMRDPPGGLPAWIDKHPLGASWGPRPTAPTCWRSIPTGKIRRLRHRHPQLRRARRSSHDRRRLLLDQRARRPGRQSGAGLRHPGARGRILWLALVLHRRQ